jgi:S-adenosylmethionine synthetase
MIQRTAEVVSPKHPDKLCDRVSDAILDLFLEKDPLVRCAVETCGGHGKLFITGEITYYGPVIEESQIKNIAKIITGIEPENVTLNIVAQSPEIAQGVDTGGAGDQGIMIGYACNDNEEYIPQEYYLARKLNREIYKEYPYDGKTQVTIAGKNVSIVASFQMAPKSALERICKAFAKTEKLKIKSLHCNPAGDWKLGGFDADAGVTGRKLAVDNYGPRVPLGGGAFSGKDATKVDRSAAYMARYIAVDLLKKKKAEEVFVELSYAIGHNRPIQATATVDGKQISLAKYDYKLAPNSIISFLDLRKPIFAGTATWGHMGRGFNWN